MVTYKGINTTTSLYHPPPFTSYQRMNISREQVPKITFNKNIVAVAVGFKTFTYFILIYIFRRVFMKSKSNGIYKVLSEFYYYESS